MSLPPGSIRNSIQAARPGDLRATFEAEPLEPLASIELEPLDELRSTLLVPQLDKARSVLAKHKARIERHESFTSSNQ